MYLKRWGSILLILMITLAACGTADPTDLAMSDTGVEPSITPDGASPLPVMSSPTERVRVEPTATATSKLKEPENNIQTLPISASLKAILSYTWTIPVTQRNSIDLLSWSPDGKYILYIERTSNELYPLYVFNPETGEHRHVAERIVTGITKDYMYDIMYGKPEWVDCCHILIRQSIDNSDQQRLYIIDLWGNIEQDLGTSALGSIILLNTESLYVVNTQGIQRIYPSKETYQLSSFKDHGTLASYVAHPSGIYAYIEQKNILTVKSLTDMKVVWQLHINDIAAEFNLSSVSIFNNLFLSSDGTEIATLILPDNKLVIRNTYESGIFQEVENVSPLNGRIAWSPTGDLIAWINRSPNPGTSSAFLMLTRVSDGKSIAIDSGVKSHPIWHPSGLQLATMSDNQSSAREIRIYSVEK